MSCRSDTEDPRMIDIPGSLPEVFEIRQVALQQSPRANWRKIALWATIVMLSAGALIGIGVLIGYAAWGSADPPVSPDTTNPVIVLPTPPESSIISSSASCAEILSINSNAVNGLYNILDEEGSLYRTYCDMQTGGGGWTLVASVHENKLGGIGRCTVGDRWSSQHGPSNYKTGDGAWESTSVFGAPEACTSDDYKNPGYYNMIAKDIMIWHVPNKTPIKNYERDAFMEYHTENGILQLYGGNLKSLFAVYHNVNYVYERTSGNGPSAPVVWDRGNNNMMVDNTPPNMRAETTPGYVQFRVINNEREAYALCPGVRMNDGKGNVEHVCVGGAGSKTAKYCGDFGGKDYDGYATGTGWSSNKVMTESVVMIFYR